MIHETIFSLRIRIWSHVRMTWWIVIPENLSPFCVLWYQFTDSSLFSVTGEVYDLLGQYYSSVCKSCLSRRPDVSLYSFIYQQVSSSPAPDDSDGGSARQHVPSDCCWGQVADESPRLIVGKKNTRNNYKIKYSQSAFSFIFISIWFAEQI